ncbi:Crp/Fnr family transcriptional regulator [Maridesulfovibrio ferrireducens]|uniref:Crp/Fnr family transcriptional regulator n=1 Tax=Maridesulfovibrio ferrireducens TaxID=246191 RepID=UPI0026F246D2|nr:cyclic nucleotide-binding domain-containing protein [Maridesulfovibrio ferrireducens]
MARSPLTSITTKTSPTIRNYHKGKVIFHEGQESKVAYMIKSGSVNVFKNIDNKKTVLMTLHRGDIFGEMSLLANEKRSVSVEAASYCELVPLTEDIMNRLLDASPVTIKKIVELLAERVLRVDNEAVTVAEGGPFLSLATILDLAYKDYAYIPRDKKREIENYEMGLSVKSFTETVKSLAVFSTIEIDSFLHTIFKFRLIDIKSKQRSGKSAFVERYIKIPDFNEFMSSLRKLYSEVKELGADVEYKMNFMTFSDLAVRTGSRPEFIYNKVMKEEFPENLLFFNRAKAINWSKDKEPDFFKKFKRPKKSLNEIDNVDDFVFIDNPTLQIALKDFNYYKISVLYSAADEQNKKKIVLNINRKQAGILQSEPPAARDVSDLEVLECSDEVIDIIKKLKGL